MRTGGFALFPLDGDGGIAESAPELAPVVPAQGAPRESTQREHPRSAFASASFPGGPCASSPALLGGLGADGVWLLSQMLQDCPKARREVELHWRASQCAHIVRIMDVYENLYQGRKCLLIVMEW